PSPGGHRETGASAAQTVARPSRPMAGGTALPALSARAALRGRVARGGRDSGASQGLHSEGFHPQQAQRERIPLRANAAHCATARLLGPPPAAGFRVVAGPPVV